MKINFSLLLLLVLLLGACGDSDTSLKEKDTSRKEKVSMPVNESKAVTDDTASLVIDTTTIESTRNAPKEVVLKFNLEKGRSYVYNMYFDIEQEKKGQKITTSMNWKYKMEVTDDKDGVKTLKATYDRIAMGMNMGGQMMEFSSDQPAGDASNPFNMISNMFSAMKGKSFFMKVNKKGEIIDIQGFDDLAESLVREMKVPEESRQSALMQFKSQFNDKDVKETFSQTFNIFPDKAVKVGDSWEKEINSRMGITKGKMMTTYRVKQIIGDRVILSATSKVHQGGTASEGTQAAQLVVDAKTGLVFQNNFEMKMEGGQAVGKGKIIGKEL
jgi:hypothetical protein